MGAIVNIILNFILIPIIGGIGAAIATLTSYLIIVIIRVIDIRNKVVISIKYSKWVMQIFVLIVEALCAGMLNSSLSYYICGICTLILMFLDYSFLKKVFIILKQTIRKKRLHDS